MAEAKRSFLDFLDQGDYMHNIDSMLKQGSSRLMLNLDELRRFDADLTRNLLRAPAEYLPPFEEALREPYSFLSIDFQQSRDHPEEAFKVRFERALNISRIK